MKENRGVSVIAFIIVIAVLVIIASCIIVYLLNNPVKEKIAVQNTAPVTEVNYSIKDEEKETKTTAMTSDKKFSSYVSNLKREMKNKIVYSMEGETHLSSINEKVSFKEYETDGSLTNIQEHDISLSSEGKLVLDQKTIAENVIKFKVLQRGTNGLHYIVFVKEDGTAAYMRISKLKTIANDDSIHEIKNVKYIIDVLGTIETYDIGLIDIEGNIIKVSIE